jgi:hypothetical protein
MIMQEQCANSVSKAWQFCQWNLEIWLRQLVRNLTLLGCDVGFHEL